MAGGEALSSAGMKPFSHGPRGRQSGTCVHREVSWSPPDESFLAASVFSERKQEHQPQMGGMRGECPLGGGESNQTGETWGLAWAV